uniref:Large ribosomal subunit protein mL49 n=1 Tax=Sciurus vulgaris TaxID=55149 RepID=A0A8D2CSD2_SCIVU
MAAAALRASLRGWSIGVQRGLALRHQSQTQGPPDYPSFVESVDEYRFVERLLPPTSIPKPPKHEHYPTPSGWQPPRGSSLPSDWLRQCLDGFCNWSLT